MNFLRWMGLLAILAMAAVRPVTAGAAGIDEEADRLLRKSCSSLAEARSLSFHADITFDELDAAGKRVVYSGAVDTALQRPDKIRTAYRGDDNVSTFWFDGESVTLMDPGSNLYASELGPGNIDSALDFIGRLGFSLPLGDLYYEDPYTGLLANVTSATYKGKEPIDGVSCHRLILVQDDIDWEIWIEDSDLSVPRKLTITYKTLPGSPQYSATMSDWNFTPDLSSRFFIFEPPLGAERIGFLPSSDHTGGGEEK